MYLEQGRKDLCGLRHLMLLVDYFFSYEDLSYYLVEYDKNQKPVRWLYDSFLLVPDTSSGNTLGSDINIGTTMSGEGNFYAVPSPNPSTLKDWDETGDKYFEPGGMLDKINNEIERLSVEFEKPPAKTNIIFLMNYPLLNQCRFGEIDGIKLNFSVLGQNLDLASKARLKACIYYADKLKTLWENNKSRFQNLNFLGYYWPFETVYRSWDIDDHWVLKELHHHINSIGYKFFWIPFWCSYNVHLLDDYENYYFDAAFMQPNYLFYENIKGVEEAAEAAKKRHAGFEMEFYIGIEEATFSDKIREQRVSRFRDYLNGGVKCGYMHGANAWFIGDNGLAKLYKSSNPEDNELYKDICNYVHGEYKIK